MKTDFSGVRALVMGLGIHGGGLESAKFLIRRGASVTITDLRSADVLAPSIKALDDYVRESNARALRYILGKHEQADFENADLVIKNPGVRPDSPYLKAARSVESDISLFLRENPARLSAVTGSKGKSFTASAIFYGLQAFHHDQGHGKAYLGGNITVSPLSFLDELNAEDDVVLELSSWQLGDLFLKNENHCRQGDAAWTDAGVGEAPSQAPGGKIFAPFFKPRIAVLTAIMSDHLDRYGTMDAYIADKRLIYKNQDSSCTTIALDDQWGRSFLRETNGRALLCSVETPPDKAAAAWFDRGTGCAFARGPIGLLGKGEITEIVGTETLTPGIHQKINLLEAGLALLDLGIEPSFIREKLSAFPGIEHRLEFFFEKDGVRYYNDTAATIPEAAAAAISALGNPILVTGGTDKMLDFSPLIKAAVKAKKIILLAGSASDKLEKLFAGAGIPCEGPFDKLTTAVKLAVQSASCGDIVVLSPGCASFGMFLNEFDRGRKWKQAVFDECSTGAEGQSRP
ncbi:MAG: UDP-N-acetylmuramoyl-L-alanine--D-glutamate ligase [Spirochaetaceae bacterium]|jgi:UDP-N-acetylmuramoylalanine--D-glutamate ligase|nr:UDP-N-acetylmuramoyl-L-alanine--D-glutamate ligase [Spirochaetaceae bacterium]